MGSVTDIDLTQLFDAGKSLAEGAIPVPGYSADGWFGRIFGAVVPSDVPIGQLTETQRRQFLYGGARKIKVDGVNLTYEGLVPKIQKSILSKDVDALQPHVRAFVERAVTFTACPDCGGTRLNEGARSSKIQGISVADARCRSATSPAGSASSTSRRWRPS